MCGAGRGFGFGVVGLGVASGLKWSRTAETRPELFLCWLGRGGTGDGVVDRDDGGVGRECGLLGKLAGFARLDGVGAPKLPRLFESWGEMGDTIPSVPDVGLMAEFLWFDKPLTGREAPSLLNLSFSYGMGSWPVAWSTNLVRFGLRLGVLRRPLVISDGTGG